MNKTEEADAEPEDAPEILIQTAKKHYKNLYRESIMKVILYAIPALLFTIGSIFLYVKSKTGFNIDGVNYIAPDYYTIIMISAAIICWGLFFWLKVRSSHKQAELWRKSMESYEALVLSESQFKTKEEKKEASKRSLRKAQRELAKQNRKAALKPIF